MKRMVLLTNILSPYRSVFYQCLYEHGKRVGIDFKVLLMNDTERSRQWKYEDFATEYCHLLKKKVFLGKEDSLYINVDLEDWLNKLMPDILIMAGSYTFLPVWQAKKWGRRHQECQMFFWSESHLNETRNYNKLIYFIRDFVRKSFYSKMDGFWYPGEMAKQLIEKYAAKNAKYIQVPNLIDNQKYAEVADRFASRENELRKKYGLATNKKVFFSPMRLIKVKGLLPFLAIAAQVGCKEKMQIVVAGEGELEEESRAFAAEKSLDLKLLGYKSGEEVAELLSCSDVFFMPSLSDASPLACVEALWCRKPLLVSRHVGNAPEVVEVGKNGFVFSYENYEEAIKFIEILLNQSEEWYKIAGNESRRIAEEIFDLEKNTDRILKEVNML